MGPWKLIFPYFFEQNFKLSRPTLSFLKTPKKEPEIVAACTVLNILSMVDELTIIAVLSRFESWIILCLPINGPPLLCVNYEIASKSSFGSNVEILDCCKGNYWFRCDLDAGTAFWIQFLLLVKKRGNSKNKTKKCLTLLWRFIFSLMSLSVLSTHLI